MIRHPVVFTLVLCVWAAGCDESTSPTGVEPPDGASDRTTDARSEPRTMDSSAQPALSYNSREGRTVFRHYCAPCHGQGAQGDGFNAFNLDPRPRDLSDPAFQAARSDEDLAAVIRAGGVANGLSNSMPPWGRTLNRRQIQNVVRFVRELVAETERGDEP